MASEIAQKVVSLQPEPCSPTVDHESAVYIGMRIVDGQQAFTAEVCALGRSFTASYPDSGRQNLSRITISGWCQDENLRHMLQPEAQRISWTLERASRSQTR